MRGNVVMEAKDGAKFMMKNDALRNQNTETGPLKLDVEVRVEREPTYLRRKNPLGMTNCHCRSTERLCYDSLSIKVASTKARNWVKSVLA